MLTILILLSPLQVFSFLDKLNPIVLSDFRVCLAKQNQSIEVLCNNRIYSFLSAATLSIQEIYTLYEQEAKTKISTVKIYGVQVGLLQLIASIMLDTSNHPNRAMYGYNKQERKMCWCSYTNDLNQFIQAGSTVPLMFYAVGTRGDPEADNRITTYRLQYSLDGYEWINYKDSYVFNGNTDRDTEVLNNLDPFVARSVRLVPVTWTGSICTRVEFTVSKIVYDPLPPRSSNEILIPGLLTGLNMVPYTIYNPECDHSRAHLDLRTNKQCQSWAAGVYDNNQRVIIAAHDYVWWHRVSVQGRGELIVNEYTTSVSFASTLDGITWTPYKDSMTFPASYDKWSVTSIELEPIFAIAIKIFIRSYYITPCGRFEAYYTRS